MTIGECLKFYVHNSTLIFLFLETSISVFAVLHRRCTALSYACDSANICTVFHCMIHLTLSELLSRLTLFHVRTPFHILGLYKRIFQCDFFFRCAFKMKIY